MITINDLQQGMWAWARANGSIPLDLADNFYTEEIDFTQLASNASRKSLFIQTLGGVSSVRSAVDKINFRLIVSDNDYSDARDLILAIYRELNSLFDILEGDATKGGFNGYWACDTFFAIDPTEFENLGGLHFFALNCRTTAEVRG